MSVVVIDNSIFVCSIKSAIMQRLQQSIDNSITSIPSSSNESVLRRRVPRGQPAASVEATQIVDAPRNHRMSSFCRF